MFRNTAECLLEANAVKRAKHDMGHLKNDSRSNYVREECHEIVFGMCSVQCGSMEAKALSHVLHTAGCEHHHLSTKRMFVYVYIRMSWGGGWE